MEAVVLFRAPLASTIFAESDGQRCKPVFVLCPEASGADCRNVRITSGTHPFPPCPVQDSPNKWRLDKWANDLSCAVFSLANVVTIMYYIVDTSTHVRAHACYLSCPYPSCWEHLLRAHVLSMLQHSACNSHVPATLGGSD